MTDSPSTLAADLTRSRRLAWWTLFWQASVVVVMYAAMGSSQTMKSAWVEDFLGLVPATVFLIALRYERRPPTQWFPYGFARANSLAFLISATALCSMGLYLIGDSTVKLLAAEHPSFGTVDALGHPLWAGWVMVAALLYSVVPPFILGRMKLPLARRTQDKVLHTDALMQKADWMTGAAGVVGILGVGMGFWWADAAAAIVIAVDIVRDGLKALRIATAELVDGTPRALDKDEMAEDAEALRRALHARYPETRVRLRESGRYILAEVSGPTIPDGPHDLDALWPGDPSRRWRLRDLSFRIGATAAADTLDSADQAP